MAKTYDKVRYIETSGFNPHYNLALESALMDAAKDGELIVYLWRNDNTVVIGRHQNAYLDVNIKKLHDAGGFCWDLGDGVGRRYRAIGVHVCYDNEKTIVGYDICTEDMGNVNIKIRENSIEFIEDSNFQGFSKEEIEDLYDVLKNHIMY